MSLAYYYIMGKDEAAPSAYEPESVAYFARANASVSDTDKTSYDTLIKTIKTGQGLTLGVSNLATILPRFYIWAITSQASEDWRLDFYSDTYNVVGTNLAFTENVGLGASNPAIYGNDIGFAFRDLDSSFIDDIIYGGYVTTSQTLSNNLTALMTSYQGGGNSTTLYFNNGSTNQALIEVGGRVNQSSAVSATFGGHNAITGGNTVAVERIGTTVNVYKDSTLLSTATRASTGLPTVITKLFSYDGFGLSMTAKTGVLFIGKSSLIDYTQLQSDIKAWVDAR